ncbi:LINE-1 reverse transcriptase isogeny [Sesbania bispinosa]|nr:LINE-1 reverse transcriptase isogeny [Sesbania bispinosa]
MLKVDFLTSIQSTGRFARICVELDLEKKLVPKIKIFGHELSLKYEGLHLVCFHYGKYGNHMDSCSDNVAEDVPSNSTTMVEVSASVQPDSTSRASVNIVEGNNVGYYLGAESGNLISFNSKHNHSG